MDQVDVAILARLISDPTAKLQSVARALNRSRSSIHDRIGRLRRSGVFRGVVGLPNPGLFGKVRLVCIFDGLDPLPDPALLFALPEVIGYTVSHEDQLSVRCYVDADRRLPTAALLERVGRRPRRVLVQASAPIKPGQTWLSKRQWRVLTTLVPDVRTSLVALARQAQTTTKTASRIRRGLIAQGQLQWEVNLLPNLAQDVVLYHVWAKGARPQDLDRLRGAVPDLWLERESEEPSGIFLVGASSSLADALAVPGRIGRAAPGVTASIVIRRQAEYHVPRLVEMCRDEAARQAKALRAAAAPDPPTSLGLQRMRTKRPP